MRNNDAEIDDNLIRQIKLGDENAARELVARYYAPILRYCKHHCYDIEKAEDLTQETFLKLFKNLSSYTGKRKFKFYLYTIANHLCIDESRKTTIYNLENEENLTYESDDVQRIETKSEIDFLLNVLSSEQREAVILRFGEQAEYLSEIFRFEGLSIFGLQALTLFCICVTIYKIADVSRYIPAFIPLFVLAVMPVMFKCQYYNMSEIEAVTRSSASQIVLAKLILAGAANLVCMTVLIFFETNLQNSSDELLQIILYCLVPYLFCMIVMLHLIRIRKKGSIQICAITILCSCIVWKILARISPWIYETSAVGFWIVAFLFFAVFFAKEIYFIISIRKEGKIYGIIA